MKLATILAATACLFVSACHTTGSTPKQCHEKKPSCESCECKTKGQCKEKNKY